MMKKFNDEELARALVPLVGGGENIADVNHCATRLRFILKNENLADSPAIETLPGVVKAFSSGGQYQVIIGTAVPGVFSALEDELNRAETKIPDPGRQEIGEPVSWKRTGRFALGKLSAFLAACIQPLIPLFVSVGMIHTLVMILGPAMLGWLDAESGTYRVLSMVGEAGFASLPIFIAWSTSNYLKTNTVLALFYGSFLVYADFIDLMNSGETISFFGLRVPAVSYTAQIVPVMLIMITMYLVEKMLRRFLPEKVRFILMPNLETLIMLPLMLCLIGPIGTILGNYISEGAIGLYHAAGPLSVALIGALFIFVCATGMHTAIIATAFTMIEKQGFDNLALVGAGAAAYACFGLYLACAIFAKDHKTRALSVSALLTHVVGGVAEPGMFTILLTNGRLLGIEFIASFFGALYLGVRGVGLYTPGISNFMAVFQYAGGGSDNFRNAVIGCGISFAAGFILTAVVLIREKK